MRALILGAAGFLGTNLVEELLGVGITPVCGRRPRTNVIALRKYRVPLVLADLDDPQSLREAMTDIDVVFHLAGHYPKLSLHKDMSLALGLRQLRNVLDAVAESRVHRLVYVSSTATVAPAVGRASNEGDLFGAPPGFGTYHDLKWAMERMVSLEDRFQTVVACPGACLGPWDLRVGTSALLVGLARGLSPAHPDGVINLVDVRDVARALRLLGVHADPPRRVVLSAHNLQLHPFMVDLAEHYGVGSPPKPLTSEEAIVLANAEELRCEGSRERPKLSREIVDLIIHGSPIDASMATDTLGVTWCPLTDTLQAFDEWSQRMRLIPKRDRDTSNEQYGSFQARA